jgi:Tfp pilus assembly protein PilE
MVNDRQKTGFSIIELIIAVGILAAFLAGTTYLIVGSFEPFIGKGNTREMERFASEAIDILHVIKERSWTDIATYDDGTAVKVVQDTGGEWVFSTADSGVETRGSFTRTITMAAVQRDSSDVLVSSGETVDPSTVKAVITVSVTGRPDYKLEAYLTNWEAYRMKQSDWRGTFNDDSWSVDSTNWQTTTFAGGGFKIDLPTSTTGDITADFITLAVTTST